MTLVSHDLVRLNCQLLLELGKISVDIRALDMAAFVLWSRITPKLGSKELSKKQLVREGHPPCRETPL